MKTLATIGLLVLIGATVVHSTEGYHYFVSSQQYRIVMHISDTHIDPMFDAYQSMAAGVCHSCDLSSRVHGDKASCPNQFLPDSTQIRSRTSAGYAFGRYGCNPPHLLFASLRAQMRSIDPHPKVVVFTGDISPHGYPDDNFNLKDSTKLDDLCDTKFLVTRHMVEDLVRSFPDTRWAYAMGNNDHFPKDRHWQPYIEKYGDMLLSTGFFTEQQHNQFINNGGSSFVDMDGVRYISLDYTLFISGGEDEADVSKKNYGNVHALYPIRHKVCGWLKESLEEAQRKGLSVYIVGHQPLSTKNGKDEMDVESFHFQELKNLFEEYRDIIKVGLFGHRNLAGLSNVLSNSFEPLFPAITGPGVSPRGKNNPSFIVLYQAVEDGRVLDFEQWKFHLMDENFKAQEVLAKLPDIDKGQVNDKGVKHKNKSVSKKKSGHDGSDNDSINEEASKYFYLGEWDRHSGILKSWKVLSGATEFTSATLSDFMGRVAKNQHLFMGLEVWKRAGFIGDETPEAFMCKQMYDRHDEMRFCLFPNQDKKCWDNDWLE